MQFNKTGNTKSCIRITCFIILIFMVFILSYSTTFAKEPDSIKNNLIEVEGELQDISDNIYKDIELISVEGNVFEDDFKKEICTNEECDELPNSITDCYTCIYNGWDNDLKQYTAELCEQYQVPYKYVLAIIWNESRFQPEVQSKLGDTYNYGLMQVNSINYEFLEEQIDLENLEDLYDPKVNILAGITLLNYHRDYVNNEKEMILRYQVGDGNYSNLQQQGINSLPVLKKVLNKAEDFAKII